MKGKVFDVSGSQDLENRQVIAWNRHNGLNQQWDIVYVDEAKPEPKKGEMSPWWGFVVERPFYIVSEMKAHRYLQILNNDAVIKTPNGQTYQQFYFDQRTRTIRSMANKGYSLSIQSHGRNRDLRWEGSNAVPW